MYNNTYILYSEKFSPDKIFRDFVVGLTSAKIKSANKAFLLFHSMTMTMQHPQKFYLQNFIFLEPSAKFCPTKFPAIRYVCTFIDNIVSISIFN